MTTDMTCAAFAETLADFLERDVSEATRAAVESHAVTCVDCGALLADLRALRVDASRLPELTPSRDLWAGIAARIDAPVIPIGTREAGRGTRARGEWVRWTRLSTAAALLIAATSATTYYLTVRGSGRSAATSARLIPDSSVKLLASAGQQPVASSPDSVSSASPLLPPASREALPASRLPRPAVGLVSNRRPTAEQVYDNEIGRLRAIVERRRAQLDPVTISLVERNLKVIDDAIAQCRSALAKDPASRFLMESLNNALENKVELLRTAALLPSRT